jgi:glycosyltransferase involved in cell wall biosynthesis
MPDHSNLNFNYSPNRPKIKPVPDGIARPLWSVMIPTYNCAKYLRETLASVLAQDPGPDMMQITVVDDHSTQDNPATVVEELGRGRIEFYQQSQNVGITRNFQTCLELSRGHLVHQLHGDDCVRDGFYQTMQNVFEQHQEIGAACCRTIFMSEDGHWQSLTDLELPKSGILPRNWLQRIAEICCIPTPSIVIRRVAYEKLGGFDLTLRAVEDWEMWFRIALNYPIWYETEPLAIYRTLSHSNTGRTVMSGAYVEDLYRVTQIIQSCSADIVPNKIFDQAKQNCAFFALQTAEKLLNEGNLSRAITQIQAALKFSPSFRSFRSASRIILWDGTLYLIQKIAGKSQKPSH